MSIKGESNDVDPKTVNEHKAKKDSFFIIKLCISNSSLSRTKFVRQRMFDLEEFNCQLNYRIILPQSAIIFFQVI